MRTKHVLEYVALRAATGLLGRMPYRAALGLTWGFAWIGHRVIRRRRTEARRRIRAVLGDGVSEARVRRIAWISWRNLCFNAVEMARFPRLTDRWLDRYADVRVLDRCLEIHRAGRSAVIAAPHAGNWDLAGVVLRRRGVPIFFIVRRQKNPLADAWINRMRAATGARTVLNDAHLLRGVLRHLRDGLFMAILPDVRVRRGGIDVPFLNGVAHLGPGTAVFARQAGVAILPVLCRREGWTRHTMRVFDAIEPDPALSRDADVERITRRVAEVLNAAILEEPEQYFWYNKRWVLDPPDPPAAPKRPAAAPPAPPPPRPLVLLDIDGTLLHARGGGRAAFTRALRAEFGWEDDLAYINFAGATDLDVLRRVGERHGAAPDAAAAERFFRRLAVELEAGLAAEPPEVFPGVRELLRALGADREILVGLVTGNTGECAHIKLRHAGIHGHFVLGAFGHEHADRTDIARLALRRAEAHARGRRVGPVVLIGDTPADIAAARAIGARAVAVATGKYDAAALRAAGADLAVGTLDDPALPAALAQWRAAAGGIPATGAPG